MAAQVLRFTEDDPRVDFVIVGGGRAGASAIETLLKHGVDGKRITLIGAETELPYNRPPLSKGYLLNREARESVFVKPRSFYDTAGVELLLGTRVTAVRPDAHAVTTDAGQTITYGNLLLATGCAARRLTVPGSDSPGIFTLRSLADADALNIAAARSRRAVVVGGSFIGMELASAFAQRGLETTLLHRGTAVFDKLGSPEVSAFFAEYFSARGVTVRTEDEAMAFARTPDGSLAVTTKRGDTLGADLVAAGVGVTPDTDFLRGSGIAVDNGVVVNEYLEASVPDVYAAGDIANFLDPLYGRQRRIEHWDTAIQHGKIAGANMAGHPPTRIGDSVWNQGQRTAYDAVSMFFSDVFDLSFEFFGDATGTDQTVQRGAFTDRAVTLFFLSSGIVRAAFTMGRASERKALIALIRNRHRVADQGALSHPDVPLPNASERGLTPTPR